jgi:biotin carboxyl carrier protein
MKYRLEQAGTTYEIDVRQTSDGYVVCGPDGRPRTIRLTRRADGSQLAITPWGDSFVHSARRGGEVWAEAFGRRLSARVQRVRPGAAGAGSGASVGAVHAPMTGKLLRVSVKVGDVVQASQPVAVIEAMKMENELLAPLAGVVVEVGADAPGTVEKGALVVRVEPQ